MIIVVVLLPQYSTEGKIKEPNLAAEAGKDVISAVTSYARGDMGGVLRSAMGFVKTATGGANAQRAEKVSKATRTSSADVVRSSNQVYRLSKYVVNLIVHMFHRFLGVVVKILKRVLILRKLVIPLVQ